MKKSICTVLLLATAVLAQAQASQFPFEKISKAACLANNISLITMKNS